MEDCDERIETALVGLRFFRSIWGDKASSFMVFSTSCSLVLSSST